MENSIRYSLQQLQEALNQKSESVILEEYLTKILAAQERTAKAVEMLVEQTNPNTVEVHGREFSSEKMPAFLSELARKREKPGDPPKVLQAYPPFASLVLSLAELEYIQGWYENALHTEMSIVPEERAIMTKIEHAIAEIERRNLGYED